MTQTWREMLDVLDAIEAAIDRRLDLNTTAYVVRKVTPGDGQSMAYHAGRLPPNYPVPAVRYKVEWYPSKYVVDLAFCVISEWPTDNDDDCRICVLKSVG